MSEPLRAITLTQPWCGLVASGIKRVENRSRRIIGSTMLGKRIAIHASREIDESIYDLIAERSADLKLCADENSHLCQPWYNLSRKTSAILAVATLERIVIYDEVGIESLPEDQRRWFFGPIGYLFTNIIELPVSIRCNGMLGLWRVPDEIAVLVRDQLPNMALSSH